MGWLLLIAGLALWTGAHLYRAVSPSGRAALAERMGEASKGIFAVLIVLGIVLMVLGYRAAPFVPVWTPPDWTRHLNNLFVLVAFYIYFTTATKPGTAWAFGSLRHPQLVGFSIWAVAHLLVNGDLASLLLFGGLLAWALTEIAVANRSPSLVDRSTAKIDGPFVHLGLVVVAFVVVALIHGWVGPWPFG